MQHCNSHFIARDQGQPCALVSERILSKSCSDLEFFLQGHERLARMLLVTRRNYPVAIKRSGWRMRGNLFSDYGILIRSVTADQTSTVSILRCFKFLWLPCTK